MSKGATCEELEIITINDDVEKFFQVGALPPSQKKEELIVFLKRNIYVFAWNAYEAPGMDPNFIYHNLNVSPSAIPKKQPS